jgi:hypothetical protein
VVRLDEPARVFAALSGLEQSLARFNGRDVIAPGEPDEPQTPQDKESARGIVETIDHLQRRQIRRLHDRRRYAVDGDERGAERNADVQNLSEGLGRLRKLGQKRKRVLEEADRFPVREARDRLRACLA